jgi:hypothetical protein
MISTRQALAIVIGAGLLGSGVVGSTLSLHSESQAGHKVLLLSLHDRDGQVEFDSALLLSGPMKQAKQWPPGSWQVRVVDDQGRTIHSAGLPNPRQLYPPPESSEAYSFTVRVPYTASARFIAIFDSSGREVYTLPLTDKWIAQAEARGRQMREFLNLQAQMLQESLQRYGQAKRLVQPGDAISSGELPERADPQERDSRLVELQAQMEAAREDLEEIRRWAAGSTPVPSGRVEGVVKQGGGTLSGSVRDESGAGVGRATVSVTNQNTNEPVGSTMTSSSGAYAIVLPAGRYIVGVTPQSNRLLPVRVIDIEINGDRTLSFTLPAAWLLSGRVTNEQGAAVGRLTLTARHQATGAFVNSTLSSSDGQYFLPVGRETVKIFVYPPGGSQYYGRLIRDVQLTADATLNISLSTGVNLSGMISRADGNRISQGTVYAVDRDEQQVAASAPIQMSGGYTMRLAPGQYDLYVNPSPAGGAPSGIVPKRVEDISISRDTTLNVTLDSAGFLLSGVVRDRAGAAVAGGRLMAIDEATNSTAASATSGTNGAYSLALSSGRFRIVLTPPMGALLATTKIPRVVIERDQKLDLTMNPGRLISGRFVTASGAPVNGASFRVYDDANSVLFPSRPLAGNEISIITPTSGRIFVVPPPNTNFIAKVTDIEDLPGAPPYGFVFDELPGERGSGQVTQIYGSAATQDRVNIVFIGDGYTGINESFTDVNGNGQWDGDVLLDLNGNGRQDPGEPFRDRNGNGRYDPPEPFTDSNGDGLFNFNEQGLYDRNVMDYTRVLLSVPPWSEYADFINIYKIRLVSPQAGGDFPNLMAPVTRDTPLDLQFGGGSYSLETNNAKTMAIVQSLVPHFDHIVILCHSPWGIGGPNARFGGSLHLIGTDPSIVDTVITHEFGHAFGFLADEYALLSNGLYPYRNDEPGAMNVTTVTDRGLIKWGELIADDMPLPTPAEAPGVGLFKGGLFYGVGIYRPQHNCMMRDANVPRYCSVCLRQMRERFQAEVGR